MWLYVYFPHLFLEGLHRESIMQQPLALLDARQQVMDVNTLAAELGVEVGMSLPTALCLANELQLVSFDASQLQPVHFTLHRRAQNFSAWVALDGEQGLYLEIGSMQRLLGDAQKIAAQLRLAFPEFTLVTAAAPFARCARLLARSNIEGYLSRAQLKTFLGSLAVQDLAFNEKHLSRLSRLGIQTLGQLLRLKSNDIAYRIGADLAKELDYVSGRSQWLPTKQAPALVFQQRLELLAEVENAHFLVFPLSRMMKQLEAFLIEHCVGCKKIQLRFDYRDDGYASLDLVPAKATARADEWLFLLKNKLEQLQLEQPVVQLALYSKWFKPVTKAVLDLFGNSGHGNDEQRAALENSLLSRLGEGSYGYLQYQESPWPERRTESVRELNQSGWQTQQHAPVFVLAQAVPVSRDAYQLLHGPERIASGWWAAQPCVRDYYVAQTPQGQLHWLYRDAQQQWFLHGYFS